MSISIAHKIEIKPNNKQKTYFRKAFGCARLAWNWGLAEWQRQCEEGKNPSAYTLMKQFNSIKKEQYPFVYKVTKYATQEPFWNLQDAFKRFHNKQAKYPISKHKKDNKGYFYIGGDQVHLSFSNENSKVFKSIVHNDSHKYQYLNVPKLGCVRMTEPLRFNGKINSVTISQHGEKYFASFSMFITEDEYLRTHPKAKKEKTRAVGIDLGIKSMMVLSDSIAVENPKPLKKATRKIKRLQRQLSKRVHAKTKQERLQGVAKSNNYKKLAYRVNRVMSKVANIRRNYIHKVTTILTTEYGAIGMETLQVKKMLKNHRLAMNISDVSFHEITRQLEYKSTYNGVKLTKADMWYASSKTCSRCGKKVPTLTLSQRVFRCPFCGIVIDRDINASLNLRNLTNKTIGADYPELTSVDLKALLCLFSSNGIATSKVEAERQRKSLAS